MHTSTVKFPTVDRPGEDLHLHVSGTGQISVLSAQGLEPFGLLQLPPWLIDAVRHVTPPPPWAQRPFQSDPDELKLVGMTLFDALFSGAVREVLFERRNRERVRQTWLRLRLTLGSAELEAFPWELCRDDRGHWLGADADVTLVRHPFPGTVLPRPFVPPLRVLIVTASPIDLPQLDVGRELRAIRNALGSLQEAGIVDLKVLEQVEPSILREALEAASSAGRGYHVVHFIGHALWDPLQSIGAVALCGSDGRSELLRDETLSLWLSSHRSLRLVVLNACQTATGEGYTGLEWQEPPASDTDARKSITGLSPRELQWLERVHGKGLALSLIQANVPAVVAMQHPVRDDLAGRFSETFYAALVQGSSVEVAVQSARRELLQHLNHREPGNLGFATPVCFLRAPLGEAFPLHPDALEGRL